MVIVTVDNDLQETYRPDSNVLTRDTRFESYSLGTQIVLKGTSWLSEEEIAGGARFLGIDRHEDSVHLLIRFTCRSAFGVHT